MNLSARTAGGFAWGVSQALGAKAVSLAGQLILARLLTKEDFGVVGLSLSVASFISVLQYAGIQEILVARQAHFRRWKDAAFWFAGAMGAGSAALCVLAGFVLAQVKGDPRFIYLMLPLAAASVLTGLQTMPTAMLMISLRTRALMTVALVCNSVAIAAAVALAWRGAGPYSQVIGVALAAPVQLGLLWWLAQPRVRLRARLRRWRLLLGDTAMLLGTGLVNNFIGQGAVLVLGLFQTDAQTGVFFWGYNISLQTVTLVTQNLALVFFPVLSKLQGQHARTLAAFDRAGRLLAVIGMPLCFAQAALVGPFLRLVYGERWLEAIPVAQILSIGLAFGILGGIAVTPLKANGLFRWLLWVTVGYTIFYLALIALGAWLGGAVNVAWGVLAFYVVAGPVGTWIVLLPFGGTWKTTWRIFGTPALLAGAAVGTAVVLLEWIPAGPTRDFAAFAVVPAVGAPLYWLLARVYVPDALVEGAQRVLDVGGRLPAPARRFLLSLAPPSNMPRES